MFRDLLNPFVSFLEGAFVSFIDEVNFGADCFLYKGLSWILVESTRGEFLEGVDRYIDG